MPISTPLLIPPSNIIKLFQKENFPVSPTFPHLPSSFPPDLPPSMSSEALTSFLLQPNSNLLVHPFSFPSVAKLTSKSQSLANDWLNGKFTHKPSLSTTRGCYLSSRGRMISQAVTSQNILLLENSEVLPKLSKMIFPLDGVVLEELTEVTVVSLYGDVRKMPTFTLDPTTTIAINEPFFGRLPRFDSTIPITIDLNQDSSDVGKIAAVHLIILSPILAEPIMTSLLSNEKNLVIGDAEFSNFQTLLGNPQLSYEYPISRANPLELGLSNLVDFDKGCYLGQEGVTAIIKNKRGFPRYLYHVVLDRSVGDDKDKCVEVNENVVRLVDGEMVIIGSITSVLVLPKKIVCLALIKRTAAAAPSSDLDINQNDYFGLNDQDVSVGGLGGKLMTVDRARNEEIVIEKTDDKIEGEGDDGGAELERIAKKMKMLQERAQALRDRKK